MFVNGQQVSDELEGTFVYHDVPVDVVSGTNALTVQVLRDHDEVFPPDNNSTDLGITFIDWSPQPPDHNMGLIRPVLLRSAGSSSLVVRAPVLDTTVDPSSLRATVRVAVEVFNYGTQAVALPGGRRETGRAVLTFCLF